MGPVDVTWDDPFVVIDVAWGEATTDIGYAEGWTAGVACREVDRPKR